ncbi:phospho-N-acetylmuramoyl-pentapeptide-transferase [Raineyella sp. W15-4]|uniref:phospho-N-acetylmuramoyl-pentapeptide- transferase n=1 Tax=Raineyella sp. W15-4 TaxID=3081651 RepID=UPI002954E740|nr:phospho-N-acetylmuramoyl-pentapeptide-transferase [Raineyella sp. W15-4]WOQ15847.1 phospho-N-acetylmuramoyl-pentapeptide-transferase [Raineyella sp. W15-4]
MTTILLAGAMALVGTLLGTRAAIGVLVRKGYGQFIRDDGPTSHHTKRGTPTMGGIVIIIAVVLAYGLAHLVTWKPPSVSALLVLLLFVGTGIVGFLDDWIKISNKRSLGLTPWQKLAGQTAVAVLFGVLALNFPDERGVTPASPFVSFLRDIPWLGLPLVLAAIWFLLLILGTSNAVNLTDGLDGLAAGASTMVFAAYALINLWQYNKSCAWGGAASATCYNVRNPHDLAVVAVALAGACFGFLWWNAKPAKIFMGDSGSLSLGGALAGLAICSRTELLLVILGGLFVIITLSVMIQTSWFKFTRWRTGTGRRVFKMAPLQHHFEMLGWSEVTIVIRFWIIAGCFVALGIGIFYGEWVTGLGLQ